MGVQNTFTFVRFYTTSRLNGEYLLNETRHRQSGKDVGNHEGSPTLSPNVMNFGSHRDGVFLPTLTILFSPSPPHTLYAALTWRPAAILNETALGLPSAQI